MKRRATRWVGVCAVGLLAGAIIGGCAQRQAESDTAKPVAESSPQDRAAPADRTAKPTPTPTPAPVGLVEVFPHVRLDAQRRLVEFDGFVPIDCHHEETPVVYLEVVACARDSKEHEALVATDAKASHIHAALLMLGIEPGTPGRWTFDGGEVQSHAPTGPGVDVTIAYQRGQTWIESPAHEWVTTIEGASHPLTPPPDTRAWLFAGSRIVTWQGADYYDADGTGVIIGLTTFGSEVIAWHEVFSHDSSVQTPEWIADIAKVPPVMTPVVVRILVSRP